MHREGFGIVLIGSFLSILLIGITGGSAQAQVKLVKPASGGTIVINKSGSYFLAANLTFGASNASAIRVNTGVNNVTINFNGFSIVGTGGTNNGGINASSNSGITVVNGTITKFAGKGPHSRRQQQVAGIAMIRNNGGGAPTALPACLITNNVINRNTGTGLVFSDATSGYQNNIISRLIRRDRHGGTNMGHNVCNKFSLSLIERSGGAARSPRPDSAIDVRTPLAERRPDFGARLDAP